jgi:hypothetical protein
VKGGEGLDEERESSDKKLKLKEIWINYDDDIPNISD